MQEIKKDISTVFISIGLRYNQNNIDHLHYLNVTFNLSNNTNFTFKKIQR